MNCRRLMVAVGLGCLLAAASAFGQGDAFQIETRLSEWLASPGGTLTATVTLNIAPDYYAYKHGVKVQLEEQTGFTLGTVEFPEAQTKSDPILKRDIEIYVGKAVFTAPVMLAEDLKPGEYELKLKVTYEGCSQTACFMPKTKTFALPVEVIESDTTTAGTGRTASPPPAGQNRFQQALEQKGILGALLLAFAAGIGLSVTPCVYPMIPITVSVIGAKSAGRPLSGFFLSLVYVLGIAITYAILGVAAASTGAAFGAMMQNPIAIGVVAAIFVALALGMFDVYYFQMPAFLTDRLGGPKGSGVLGVFITGLASGVVVSPCVGPVLISMLVYIASTGNKLLGFLMLFTMAWGMGLLLIVVGTFSGAAASLPKSGPWMETVKRFFGIVLLAMALYYLKNIMPATAFGIVAGIFLIVVGVFSGGLDRLVPESAGLLRAKKSFGLICFILGVYFFAGTLALTGVLLPPLMGKPAAQATEGVEWVKSLDEGLAKARVAGKPALLDFRADWCGICLEMERDLWPHPEIVAESKRFVAIKVDMTDTEKPENERILQEYGVIGFPTVIFVGSDGQVLDAKTIVGAIDVNGMLGVMRSVR